MLAELVAFIGKKFGFKDDCVWESREVNVERNVGERNTGAWATFVHRDGQRRLIYMPATR